jgi:uncharacterized protein YjiS (DUF1127 family)
MSAIHLHHSAGSLRHHRAGGFAGTVGATLRLWRERSRSRSELSRLDSHALHDLGLTRLDVCNEADKPFWRA